MKAARATQEVVEEPEPTSVPAEGKNKKRKERKEKVVEPAEAEEAPSTMDPAPQEGKKKKRKAGAVELEEPAPEVIAPDGSGKKRKVKGTAEDVTEAVPEDVTSAMFAVKKKKMAKAPDVEDEENQEPQAGTVSEFKVFVGGLPWKCSEGDLRKDFGDCGDVVDVKLLKDEMGRSRGMAFVTFSDRKALKAALAYDGDEYGGRTISVVKAEDRSGGAKKGKGKGPGNKNEVFVKGMSLETTEGALKKKLSDCGAISRMNMPMRDDGNCKGFAWVTFDSEDAVTKALALNGTELQGSAFTVEKSREPGKDGKVKGKCKDGKGKGNSDFEIFVKNLPFEMDEKTLRTDFLECGEIDRMHMPVVADTQKTMGFAWITFKNAEGLKKALEFNDEEYGGRRLFIEKSGQHRAGDDKGKGKGKDKCKGKK